MIQELVFYVKISNALNAQSMHQYVDNAMKIILLMKTKIVLHMENVLNAKKMQ